jgi:hypothetical protein
MGRIVADLTRYVRESLSQCNSCKSQSGSSSRHAGKIIVITDLGLGSMEIFRCAVGEGVAIVHHETRSAKTAPVQELPGDDA